MGVVYFNLTHIHAYPLKAEEHIRYVNDYFKLSK